MPPVADTLSRPTGHYLPLKRQEAELLSSSTLLHDVVDWERHLRKSILKPTKHWFESKKAFVRPPKKPTVTLAPAAKSKAPPAKGKSCAPKILFGGGGGGMISFLTDGPRHHGGLARPDDCSLYFPYVRRKPEPE